MLRYVHCRGHRGFKNKKTRDDVAYRENQCFYLFIHQLFLGFILFFNHTLHKDDTQLCYERYGMI